MATLHLTDAAIQREKELKQQLNDFFGNKFGICDFYGQLSGVDFIGLKKILSCINNIITLRATFSLVNRLFSDERISKSEYQAIITKVNEQHANTNGFDVEYGKDVKIIAEVKCNIPVNENSFGAAQIEGIKDDVEHLLKGKPKAGIDVTSYYKFMAILDIGNNIHECVEKIFKNNTNIEEYQPNKSLSTNKVYVVYVTI